MLDPLKEYIAILKAKTEISVQKRQEVNYMFDSMLKPNEGHTIFEIDYLEKVIRKATFETLDTVCFLNWKTQLKELEIIKKSNCFYITALNYKNLMKKLASNKEASQFIYDSSDTAQSKHKHKRITLIKSK